MRQRHDVADALAQLLAGLEMRDVLARQRNRVAGLGIAAGTGRPVMQGKTAETADLDAIAVGQRPAPHFQQRLLGHVDIRAEEHTSELPTLMLTSYAVFCFIKNT